MRWIPKSLFGRNLLLLGTLIVLNLLLVGALFHFLIQAPRLDKIALLNVDYIETTYALLAQASPEQRAEYMQNFKNSPVIAIVRQPEPPAARAGKLAALLDLYSGRLSLAMRNKRSTFWQTQPSPVLWIKLDVQGDVFWLGFKADRIIGDVSYGFIVVLLLCSSFALLGAALIQRRLNRPLTQLAHAAKQVGRGDLTLRLPEQGPSEIAQVAASFNQMSASLAQLESDRAIMLAGVSHDLRTPLAKMRLAIELLRSKPDAQLLDDIQRHIENIDAIIGQFLAYARIGNDETLQPVPLEPMLRALALESAKSGAVFETQIGPLPTLMLRPVAIRRVFTNLMENAQRYGRAPFALHAAQQGSALIVSVLDAGDGVAAGSEEAIKKPFVRLDAARASGGTGLGLAIAERVVRLHGGKLTLRNRAKGGLEAQVVLPVQSLKA